MSIIELKNKPTKEQLKKLLKEYDTVTNQGLQLDYSLEDRFLYDYCKTKGLTNFLAFFKKLDPVNPKKKTIIGKKRTIVFDFIIENWDYDYCREWFRARYFESPKGRLNELKLSNYQSYTKAIMEGIAPATGIMNVYQYTTKKTFQSVAFSQTLQTLKTVSDFKEALEAECEVVIMEALNQFKLASLRTMRNDAIEHWLIKNDERITPTLFHFGEYDYFVDGIAYDQKVLSSYKNPLLAQLIDQQTGLVKKDVLIKKLDDVFKQLFVNQDKTRFKPKTEVSQRLFVLTGEESVIDFDNSTASELINATTTMPNPLDTSVSMGELSASFLVIEQNKKESV